MLEKLDRNRVKGLLRARGKVLVNGEGEEILLNGWGLGNWLLCEGYMWLSRDSRSFDRPRNIEETIRDLAGSAYAERFWRAFRASYITAEDIKRMAELGYNSLRIPFNWRLFMEDEPGEIRFREEGFSLLDQCLAWCEEYRIYAFLDLHGAPGGQTGDNIDDSRDNLPRLLTDQDYWDKGIALWRELARRYRDRWIVGGYDLLNEPIRTVRFDYPNVDHL
ncbi:MAG: cellulase family glycosylhydrolase, partial [Treponema sp.]|nr:cellulase family glycosylhydrolase [Treponema sp.]